ncbi:MAG TPA: NAD(P)/FAD-dependent oxidoreductase [Thermoleophilia bacterium]|nr:NAD(P)/FAD-dependent oxidoreductase [Thermoleophilia bacterium]
MSADQTVDITVLGGGPTGLAAAYYGAHRDASVRIVESLEQLGGQVSAVYPEKHIFDVAGYPKVNGQELIDRLTEQAAQYSPEIRLGCVVERIEHAGDGTIALHTASGETLSTRTLIITAGHGAFNPRKLDLPDLERWEGNGLHYFVRRKEAFRDRRVVLVGGGDSALDWAMGLQDVAAEITLVHRRDRFRGLESSVNEVRRLADAGRLSILTPCEVREAHGNSALQEITVEHTDTGDTRRIGCDDLVTLLGFISHLGPIADWGLEFHNKRQIQVNPMMETNLPGVYAAGDVAGYEGKITLITIGFSEAAIAANHAVAHIRGEKAQPKYSTE